MRSRQTLLSFEDPQTVAGLYMERMRHLETEHVFLLLCDNKNHILKEILLSKGTVNASVVSPREIFIEALRYPQRVSIEQIDNGAVGRGVRLKSVTFLNGDQADRALRARLSP